MTHAKFDPSDLVNLLFKPHMMLFEELTTDAERAKGFIAVDALRERCQASPLYTFKKQGGLAVIVACVAMEDAYYELWYNVEPFAEGEPARFTWLEGSFDSEGFLNGGDTTTLRDFVPLTKSALIASLCATFGRNPETAAAQAIDLLAYWTATGNDERAPDAHASQAYRLYQ